MTHMNRSDHWLLATVFITGAAVLIIEIAAVRILTPFYGSSLYVFSSVLTIILLALSLGYRFGGQLADQRQRVSDIYAITALSGVSVLILLALAKFILPTTAMLMSPALGSLVFSLVLFFTPGLFLGMISPYLVKLLLQTQDQSAAGELVGKVFFWGTLGSISGSLLAGFWLIPSLGVTSTILVTALGLLLLGVTGLQFYKQTRLSLILAVLAIGATVVSIVYERTWQAGFVYAGEGVYSSIVVQDIMYRGEEIRLLMRDTNHSSATQLDSPELVFDYTKFSEVFTQINPDAESYLVLGGGAYSVPRTLILKYPELAVDVVELEPKLPEIATKYFDMPDSDRLESHVVDARVFLHQTEKAYDVIFIDLFSTNGTIPYHLVTQEFFTELTAVLSPEGIVIINAIGTPKTIVPSMIGSTARTLESVFTQVQSYALRPSLTQKQNVMFVASNRPDPLPLVDQTTLGIASEMKVLDLSEYRALNEIVLTDDRAPIEQLAH